MLRVTLATGLLLSGHLIAIGVARANGGPVAWTGTTARDGVVPRERTDIALLSEELLLND